MKPIKILIDARVVGGEAQGSATYLKELYNSFQKKFGKNYELYFAGFDFESTQAAFPFLKASRFLKLKNASKLRLLTYDLPKLIKDNEIDFAHFQYVTPLVKNCKFIVTTHDVLFNDYKEFFPSNYGLKRNLLFKSSLKKSEIRLTVSKYSRDRIAEHYKIDPQTIRITPNAVSDRYFQKVDIKSVQNKIFRKFACKNYLLYVSRIEPRKNHSMLMQAYRELRLHNRNLDLVFIGNDTLESQKEMQEIQTMKKDFPYHFHWFKGLTDQEVLDFYRGAKMFVYPSLAEGFGIPPIEAAAAGVNTLSSNKTAMHDFYFFGENFFSPNNIEELKLKLLSNLNSPPQQWELNYLRGMVKRKYSWEIGATVIHKRIQEELGLKTAKMNQMETEQKQYLRA